MTEIARELHFLVADLRDLGQRAVEILRHDHAGRAWIAASPVKRDLVDVRKFFGSGNNIADHSTQVHIVNRAGELVWRTYELPTPAEIAALLGRVAA